MKHAAKLNLATTALVFATCPSYSWAQTAIERNLPEQPPRAGVEIAPPDIVPATEDESPLGVALAAIVLISANDEVSGTGAVTGIDASRVPLFQSARLQRKLRKRFIGRPLSRKLIAEIERALALNAREMGRPFVSFSTPAQELTQGALIIRVAEFRLAYADVLGADDASATRIREGIRETPGHPVNSDRLSEDLDWLGRDPFLSVEARFAPGEETATTDLNLVASVKRPIRSYVGWNNNGSVSTGIDRLFLGTIVGIPGTGAYASYQITGSSDFWNENGKFINEDARYVSHGLRAYLPIAARQNLEMTLSRTSTSQLIRGYFDVRQRTTEAALAYRAALSDFGLPPGSGEILYGVEFKRQRRRVGFAGQDVIDNAGDIYQLFGGIARTVTAEGSTVSASLTLHASLNGISDRSASNRLLALSDGRVSSNRYAYVVGEVSAAMRMPLGFSLRSELSLQYANRPLPLSSQVGLGGSGLVRGYNADDGSFDRAILVRQELRTPVTSLKLLGPAGQTLTSPFLFLDVGYGRDVAAARSSRIASIGAGADLLLGRHIQAGVDTAWALDDGGRTKAGDWSLRGRITATF